LSAAGRTARRRASSTASPAPCTWTRPSAPVGDLTLAFEALDLAADEGLRISAYTAEPGSPSDDALKLLDTWAATLDQAAAAPAGDS